MSTQNIINNHNNNANINQPYQEYYERKRIAMIMEETNNSRIIVIPSLSNKGAPNEWLKIGGNSAYFYKYLIVPRLGKKPPTIHPDTDLNHRFKSGIIAVHWRDAFIKNMATLGYEPHQESNLLIFDLKHNFTPTEIKKLRAKETENRARTNQILKPTNAIPELFHQLIILAQTLPSKIRKMNTYYRQVYEQPLTDCLIKLFEIYIQLVDHHIDKVTAKQSLIQNIDRMNAIFIILNENKALDYSTTQRLGTLLIEIKTSIIRNIKENL